jgi:hypothetical protein
VERPRHGSNKWIFTTGQAALISLTPIPELAVKSTKRMMQDCIARNGSLDNDKFLRAVLEYRNTPHQDCKKSPAQMVFGHALRDYIPALPFKYAPSADWCMTQELRERMLAKSRMRDGEKLAEHTKQLEEIAVGTPVAIQNQTGRHPNKWDKTGIIMEVKPHEQLVIKVDGSRRLTLRNRRFVKPLYPMKLSMEDQQQLNLRPAARSPRSTPTPARPPPTQSTSCPLPRLQSPQRQPPPIAQGFGIADIEEFPDDVAKIIDDNPVDAADNHVQDEVQAAGDQDVRVEVGDDDDHIRPLRKKRPNVKYPTEQYDLSKVQVNNDVTGKTGASVEVGGDEICPA